MNFDLSAVLVFGVVALGFGLVGLTAGKFLRPHQPYPAKVSTYECGEEPIGSAWINFNPRFYLVALVFVVFEVDVALTFPVVAVFRAWVGHGLSTGLVALVELLVFTLILVVGLVWVWMHGDLAWVKKLAEVDEQPSRQPPAGRRAA